MNILKNNISHQLKRASCVLLLSSFLIPTTVINAKDIAIYRWVDKNNVVHFSQNLPKTDEYTELSTVSSFKALSKKERIVKQEAEQAAIEEQAQQVSQEERDIANKELFEKNCKAARLNIKMLSSFEQVLVTETSEEGKSKNRALTQKEKEEKLELSKKHVDLYYVD